MKMCKFVSKVYEITYPHSTFTSKIKIGINPTFVELNVHTVFIDI